MTEREYLDAIQQAENFIQMGRCEEAEKILSELYDYKPVRLCWFVANAKCLFSMGKHSEAWDCLQEKGWIFDEYPFRDEYVNCYAHWNQGHVREYYHYLEHRLKENDFAKAKEEQYDQAMTRFAETEDIHDLKELMWLSFEIGQTAVLGVICCYIEKLEGNRLDEIRSLGSMFTNFDYLMEKVSGEKENFVIIQDSTLTSDILVKLLSELGHKVYLLTSPIENDDISVEISFDHASDYGDCICIPVLANSSGETNMGNLLSGLYQFVLDNDYAVLLGTAEVYEKLFTDANIFKNVECLSQYNRNELTKQYCFGYVGNYLNYLSDLYLYDVKKEVEENQNTDAGIDFSIVIPARNSAGTLYYTLQTCLNQDYAGNYEIVVSDNSTDGKTEVYQLVKDLNDSRIKYYKTPRNLALPKSFEFAYLKARGNFVFSLGSDDGICPWALTLMKKFLDENPEETILQWKRGYYCWTGYPGSKEDELVIPGQFDMEHITAHYEDRVTYFAKILKYSFNMYDLPTMYVNSGFRKQFIKQLLEQTGRFLDGCNQDLNMGIVAAASFPKVLNIDFPLTLVGISSNSLGYVNSLRQNNDNQEEMDQDIFISGLRGDNIGSYFTRGIEFELPQGYGENFNLYLALYRAIRLGVLPDNWKTEVIDDKKMFREFFEEHVCLDDRYDRWMNQARVAAARRGQNFLNWFDEEIYKPNMVLRKYVSNQNSIGKGYKEGTDESCNVIFDGSKYGVTNIQEAVDFFVNQIRKEGDLK